MERCCQSQATSTHKFHENQKPYPLMEDVSLDLPPDFGHEDKPFSSSARKESQNGTAANAGDSTSSLSLMQSVW